MEEAKFYLCDRCGNLLVMIEKKCCTPRCCGEEMRLLVANSKDAALEKHVPEVKVLEDRIEVVVGSVIHPMLPEHHIAFIALQGEDGSLQIQKLNPGEEPKAIFRKVEHGIAFEYCNLHGLWKKEF